jgi:hypothetical protein
LERVTVTLGETQLFLSLCCSLAADRPNTISSSLRLFFSFPPTTGSAAGCSTEKLPFKNLYSKK